MMVLIPVMWSIWGVVVLLFAAVKLYALMLIRANSGQLVLDGSSQQVSAQQAAETAKLNKARSAERVLLWTVLALTVILLACHVMGVGK
jgi:hypothetical protein